MATEKNVFNHVMGSMKREIELSIFINDLHEVVHALRACQKCWEFVVVAHGIYHDTT